MKKQKRGKVFSAILALALVTSIGSTTAFASQSSSSLKDVKDIVWVDGSKQYDQNGKLLPPETQPSDNLIQPYAGTIYRIDNEKHLGTSFKIHRYITNSWIKTPYYKLKTAYTGAVSTKVEGSSTIKNAVKLMLGVDFTHSFYEEIGTETEADPTKDSKLVYLVEYDKYEGDVLRVDYDDDTGSVKEKRIGTAKYEVPVDSYIRVLHKGEQL